MPLLPECFALRRGDSTDLDRVIDLWQSLPGLTLRAEDNAGHLQPLLESGRQRLFVVALEDTLVGAVLAGDDGRRGFLYHLGVAEPMRCQGVGRALVQAAIDDLAAQGITRTHVFVHTDNLPAQQFWARLGWDQRAELTVFSDITEPNHAD
jgi:ribosomal protein S18 acetylase RimI-like enzyme